VKIVRTVTVELKTCIEPHNDCDVVHIETPGGSVGVLGIQANGVRMLPSLECHNFGLPLDSKGRIKVIGYTPNDELPPAPPELGRLIKAGDSLSANIPSGNLASEWKDALAAYRKAVEA